jgi:xanthine dehydrogenase YagT iron-sulfur-binding subunit
MADRDKPRRRGGAKDDAQEPPERGPGKKSERELSRRAFLKGTGIAVSASVLVSEGLLKASAETSPASGVVGPGPVPLTLRINGRARQLNLEPRVTLLDALRNHLDLTGAKKVCDRATCGACTVIVDGKAVYSCTLLAIEAQGREITTIEGLAPEGHLHAVSQSFVDNDAQQCGFCTPGFVMAAKAYLDSNPHPSYERVKKALNGNICRCGTYVGVRRAVLEAAAKQNGRRA